MLMQIGPVTAEIYPYNIHEVSRDTGADHVEKPVMGARPPLEFVGESVGEFNLASRLFPLKLGGTGDLDKLQRHRKSGKPLYLVRGDGRVLGWHVITDMGEVHTYLDGQGVGQKIEVDVTLRQSQGPGQGSYFSIISGVFG